MRKSELNSYLNFAKKLINVSEKIVKQNTPSKIKVNFKIDRSPVTKIDMQVERSLRKLISQKYPKHGIYGEEYQNKNLGSFLLSKAIRNSFLNKPKRVWVHTCSLDHKNALNNYIARGMKVFKTETVVI